MAPVATTSYFTFSARDSHSLTQTTSLLHHNGIYFTFSARDSHAPSNKLIKPSNKLPFTSLQSTPSVLSSSSSYGRRKTFVSTEPVEYLSPAPEFEPGNELNRLRKLRESLTSAKTLREKVHVVDCDSRVKRFFKRSKKRFLDEFKLDEYEFYLLKCLVAAGQEHVLGSSGYEVDSNGEVLSARSTLKAALYSLVEMIENWDGSDECVKKVDGAALNSLLRTLRDVEEFYNCIGGIIGLVF